MAGSSTGSSDGRSDLEPTSDKHSDPGSTSDEHPDPGAFSDEQLLLIRQLDDVIDEGLQDDCDQHTEFEKRHSPRTAANNMIEGDETRALALTDFSDLKYYFWQRSNDPNKEAPNHRGTVYSFAAHYLQTSLNDSWFTIKSDVILDNACLYLMTKEHYQEPHEKRRNWPLSFDNEGPTQDGLLLFGTPPVVVTWKVTPDGNYVLGKKAWYLVWHNWLVLTGKEGYYEIDKEESEVLHRSGNQGSKVNWTWGRYPAEKEPIEYLRGPGLVIGYRRAVDWTAVENGIAAETWGGHNGWFTMGLEVTKASRHAAMDRCDNGELVKELEAAYQVALQAGTLSPKDDLRDPDKPWKNIKPTKFWALQELPGGGTTEELFEFSEPLPIVRPVTSSTTRKRPAEEDLAPTAQRPRTTGAIEIDWFSNFTSSGLGAKERRDLPRRDHNLPGIQQLAFCATIMRSEAAKQAQRHILELMSSRSELVADIIRRAPDTLINLMAARDTNPGLRSERQRLQDSVNSEKGTIKAAEARIGAVNELMRVLQASLESDRATITTSQRRLRHLEASTTTIDGRIADNATAVSTVQNDAQKVAEVSEETRLDPEAQKTFQPLRELPEIAVSANGQKHFLSPGALIDNMLQCRVCAPAVEQAVSVSSDSNNEPEDEERAESGQDDTEVVSGRSSDVGGGEKISDKTTENDQGQDEALTSLAVENERSGNKQGSEGSDSGNATTGKAQRFSSRMHLLEAAMSKHVKQE